MSNEIMKLTIAPTAAKIMVLAMSSEFKLGKILKTVPAAVPVQSDVLLCIRLTNFFRSSSLLAIINSYLTHCR